MKPIPLYPDVACHETYTSWSRCSMPWSLYLFIQMPHTIKPVPLYPDAPRHETCSSLSRCSRPWNLYLFIQMPHTMKLVHLYPDAPRHETCTFIQMLHTMKPVLPYPDPTHHKTCTSLSRCSMPSSSSLAGLLLDVGCTMAGHVTLGGRDEGPTSNCHRSCRPEKGRR